MTTKNNFSFKIPFTLLSVHLHLIGVGLTILGCFFFTWQQQHWVHIRGIGIDIQSTKRIGVDLFDIGRLPSLVLIILTVWILFIKTPSFIKISEASRIILVVVLIFLLSQVRVYFIDNGGVLIVLISLLTGWLALSQSNKLAKTNLFRLIGSTVSVCLSIYFIIYYRAWIPGYYGSLGIGLFITLIGTITILFSSIQNSKSHLQHINA